MVRVVIASLIINPKFASEKNENVGAAEKIEGGEEGEVDGSGILLSFDRFRGSLKGFSGFEMCFDGFHG